MDDFRFLCSASILTQIADHYRELADLYKELAFEFEPEDEDIDSSKESTSIDSSHNSEHCCVYCKNFDRVDSVQAACSTCDVSYSKFESSHDTEIEEEL